MYSDALVAVSILNVVRMICCLIILLAVLFSAPIRKRKPLFAAVGILGMIMLVAMVVLTHVGNALIVDDDDLLADSGEYQEDEYDFDLYPDETPAEYLDENYSEDYEENSESKEQGEYYTDLYNSFVQGGDDNEAEDGFDDVLDPYGSVHDEPSDDAYEDYDESEPSGRNSGRGMDGDYAFPDMNGNTYASNVLGVGYTMGKRWKYADTAKLAAHDGVGTGNFYENLSSDIMTGNGYRSEMFAESDDGYKTVGVTVVYSGVTGSSEVSAELDSLVTSSGFYDRSAVAQRYGAKSAEVSVGNSVFCGKKARKVHLVANYSSGQVLYSDVIIFANNGFIGIITANSVNEDESSLLNSFYNL